MADQVQDLNIKKLIIDVRAHNLNRAVRFYQNILGLTLIKKAEDWASFDIKGAEIHLYLKGGVEGGFEFRVENIKEEIGKLKSRGVKFFADENQPDLIRVDSEEIMEFPWGKSVFFQDSEGNQISLIED